MFSREIIKQMKFYVYLLLDPTSGEIFYVGKGKGNRVFQHFKEKEGYLWMHRRFKSGYKDSIYPKWSSRDKKREKRRINRRA